MEFKDKLKKLRTDRGMTQSELANTIFVSRSAVAKWENGLGMPSEDSMIALRTYFGVSADYFATEEPETIIVEKNKKISRLSKILMVGYCVLLVLGLVLGVLLFEGYRFTSASAVHEYYHKYPTIRTADFDFYMNDNEFPTDFEAVKKYGFLYKKVEGDWKSLETADGGKVGKLYYFQEEDCTYYFIFFTGVITEMGHAEDGKAYASVGYKYRTDQIILNGMIVDLDFYCYFSSSDPIETMEIKGERIVILDGFQ